MRVTTETKERTRRRILDAAAALFRSTGFENTTTRDIAREAGIATGTLFNYFATKEAIVTALVIDAHAGPTRQFPKQEYGSLEEAIFAHAAAGLRTLKPYRKYLSPILETALSPLGDKNGDASGQSLRTQHLEDLVQLAGQYGVLAALTSTALQLYWTLYMGVLSHWTTDKSPKQEDTLALLDQSVAMFVQWLSASQQSSESEPK